ncbi:hypothetical protein AKJ48_00810 [candidate division MSBL1 archaeon SCGC-AAA261O19]|uniref:formylmethanofuran dehydrogenase n=1 Tax=candidate division MSBL1 archaeon SCGC-AAA261O19 TaxID=1698277 RepID=A0A133VES9_9EURY|nr:hypothetical protein AKJ48_00810 [candidate division MSBL1 archaeon SCGC-AAA261O19]
MIILKPKSRFKTPVEAECISPDIFSKKSLEEIKNLPIYEGNEKKTLKDLFEVKEESEDKDEKTITIQGDVKAVKQIGAEMSSGKIKIEGNAGMHLGREMKGGEIIVQGDADDWAGENMEGGLIRIKGNGCNFIGSTSWGKDVGMKGGIIVIEGNVGHEAGKRMRRGIIAVKGNTGSFAGNLMTGGTILSFGDFGERAGAGMDRGTLVAFNPVELLPTFKYDSTYNPNFLRVLLRELGRYDLPIEGKHITGVYERYSGDLAALGKGEILIWKGEE